MNSAHPSHQNEPSRLAWTRHRQLVVLLIRGATWRVSWRAAALVGTLLTAVNQGDHLLAGGINWSTGMRVAANYVIPYVVAGAGYLSSYRVPID